MTGSPGSRSASSATDANAVTATQQQPSAGHILDIAFAFRRSKALLVAVELGIFTRLGAKAMNCQSLAIEAGVSSRAARDFFDSLVALGVLDRDPLGRYFNTPESAVYLDQESPHYIGGQLHRIDTRVYGHWGRLKETVVSGRPQSGAFGTGGFDALYADPAAMKLFLEGMSGGSIVPAASLAQRFPWSRYHTFFDIGAAQGCVPVQIALTHDHLRGGGFDLPVVEKAFVDYVGTHGLSGRLRFVAGDFLRDPLPRADVLIMGRILHDWDVSTRAVLIEKAFEALPVGGALIICETLIDDERRAAAHGLLASLHMMIETAGGSEATGEDYAAWLRSAGFGDIQIEPLDSHQSAVVGFK